MIQKRMPSLVFFAALFCILQAAHALPLSAPSKWDQLRDFAFTSGKTLGLKITVDGKEELETYAPELKPGQLHISRSAAKTITSLLFGIAEHQGLVSRDEYLKDIFSAEFEKFSDSDRLLKNSIQLTHLLDMTSGITFVEDYQNPHVSNTIDMIYGSGSKDMGLYTLFQPSYRKAGEEQQYMSGNTNLLLKALQKKLKTVDYDSFAAKNLMAPLQIQNFVFEKDLSGNFIGSSQFFLSLTDYHKLGLLLMNQGKWNQTQVVPENYVNEIFDLTGVGAHTGYKLGMWKAEYEGEQFFWFSGMEGQFIIMYPKKNIVVTRLGEDQKSRFSLGRFMIMIKNIALDLPMTADFLQPKKLNKEEPVQGLQFSNDREALGVARIRVKEICSCVFVVENPPAYCEAWADRGFPAQKATIDTTKKFVEITGAIATGGQWTARAAYQTTHTGCLLLD